MPPHHNGQSLLDIVGPTRKVNTSASPNWKMGWRKSGWKWPKNSLPRVSLHAKPTRCGSRELHVYLMHFTPLHFPGTDDKCTGRKPGAPSTNEMRATAKKQISPESPLCHTKVYLDAHITNLEQTSLPSMNPSCTTSKLKSACTCSD